MPQGRTVTDAAFATGGWSSHLRRLTLGDGSALAMRTFVKPFFRRHAAERVCTPSRGLWERAVAVIGREPPAYEGCFLHWDFHPGNVLFPGTGEDCRITGVVDWV